MALPQSIDPTTLNLSGTSALSNVEPTSVTSAGASGMPNPTIAMERNEVPVGAGALLGYALGNLMGNRGAGAGNRPNQNANPNQPNNPNAPPGTPSGGTPTGNIGGVNNISFPAGTTQADIDAIHGTQNGQSKYQISGVNMQNGQVIATPNLNIGGTNLGTNTGNFGSETPLTNIGNNYFMDQDRNVYDSNGELIYTNPSTPITGGTDDSGGGYDPSASDTEQYFQDSYGNIFDYSGNLVLEYGNGYYYEPDTGNFYDSNFDVVGDDFSAYQDFFGIPTFDSSEYDDFDFSDLFDYGNYTSGSTTYIKDGGSVKGGLSTPLFKEGGSVPKFSNGSTGGIDLSTYTNTGDPLANTDNLLGVDNTINSSNLLGVNTPVTTQSNFAPTSNTSGSGIVNTISNFLGNPGVSGALLGTLISQMLNSTEQPVNRGVDMTALGRLAPRTTPTAGLGRFVPYSEYGTPTTPYNYSQLYANLGVSPFGAGTGALSPSATPTTSVTAQPTTTSTAPTAPIGGLPAITAPTTPTTPSAPQYFQDADGNIYNANGDLVFDSTTNTTTPTTQQATAPVAQSSVAPMSGLAVTTPEASSSYYSYGSDVDPAQVLSSKKGGEISKFAFGGLSRAEGGSPHGNANIPTTVSESHNPNVPIVQGRQDYREGAYVQGAGDGQSDDIPAMLADGEYVIDAETVAQLGNGSNKAGAKMLDTFRENIRAHKRSAPTNKIPPKSKSALAYLKGAK